MNESLLNDHVTRYPFWVGITEHTHDAKTPCLSQREQLAGVSRDSEGIVTITIFHAHTNTKIQYTQIEAGNDDMWARTFDDPFKSTRSMNPREPLYRISGLITEHLD